METEDKSEGIREQRACEEKKVLKKRNEKEIRETGNTKDKVEGI